MIDNLDKVWTVRNAISVWVLQIQSRETYSGSNPFNANTKVDRKLSKKAASH